MRSALSSLESSMFGMGPAGFYGFGDLPMSYGGQVTFGWTQYGLAIHQHYDWMDSVSDYWQSGAYSGGDYSYRGGSLDIDTLWSPWMGTVQNYDLVQYNGYGAWSSGPNWSSSYSHQEVQETQQSHANTWFGSSDSFHFRDDVFDTWSLQIGSFSQFSQHESHLVAGDVFWQNPFQVGESHSYGFDSFDMSQTRFGDLLFQHTESHSYHSADLMVQGMAVPFGGVDPMHAFMPPVDHGVDWLMKG